MSVSTRTGESVVSRPQGALRAALLSAGLFATVVFAPVLRLPALVACAVVAPYPLALTRIGGGGMSGALASLVATLVLAGVTPLGYALAYLVTAAIPGLVMGESLARGRGLLRGCLWAFAWLSAVCVVVLIVARPRMAAVFPGLLGPLMTPAFLEQMRAQGLTIEHIDAWHSQISALHALLVEVYPAVFVVLGGLAVAANALVLRRYLVRHDPAWLAEGEFERLRWPLAIVVVFVLSVAGLLAPALRSVAANVLVLVAFLFVLQGLAVVSFVGRRLLPPAVPWVIALILGMAHVLVPIAALALVGLFDQWIDARHRAESPSAEDD